MRVVLTKVSDEVHRLTIERGGQPAESVEVETRSYLVHDLVHFAVERALATQEGFYGLLARGVPLAKLNDRTQPWDAGSEIARVEKVVGLLQHVAQKKADFAALMSNVRSTIVGADGEDVPPWLDEAFAERVTNDFRRLWGEWRSVRVGQSMTLVWSAQNAA